VLFWFCFAYFLYKKCVIVGHMVNINNVDSIWLIFLLN
jgi:hypothetical protein